MARWMHRCNGWRAPIVPHAPHYLSSLVFVTFMFFFFQAEDGIRDLTVTEVQTCALPISRAALRARLVHPATHEQVDDVIAAAFPAPRSYTGEDVVEISTHGGLLIPGEAVAALVAAVSCPAPAGEFSRRGAHHGRTTLVPGGGN